MVFNDAGAVAATQRVDVHQKANQQPQQLPLATEIASRANQVAKNMDTVGWCYAGVKQALNSVGVALSGAAAWMAAGQLEQDHRFAIVKQTDLHRGDILVHGKSPTHPYGHICVYLGHGEEASDHIQHLILNGSYGRTVVFRPTGGANTGHANRPIRIPTSVVVAAGDRSRQQIAYGDHYNNGHSSVPRLPKPPAPTAAEIAQAKHEADLYAYLYDQGCVSRNDAQAKMLAWKSLEPSAGDKIASSR